MRLVVNKRDVPPLHWHEGLMDGCEHERRGLHLHDRQVRPSDGDLAPRCEMMRELACAQTMNRKHQVLIALREPHAVHVAAVPTVLPANRGLGNAWPFK
jgi:hypothetical protein